MPAALFFDVDGTLIDSFHNNREVSPAVRAELARVQGLGHKLFLSSGRPRLLITPDLLELGFDGLVLANGGYVEMGGQSIHEDRMGAELAHKVVDFLEGLGEPYLIASANALYTLPTNHAMREFFAEKNKKEVFTFDYDLDEVLTRAIKMETLTPQERRAWMTAKVAETFGTEILCDGHGGRGTFELFPQAISKARGIEVALEKLGIDVRDSYAFGDGSNDLEMIRYCGCGVAMGNAEDLVKAEADIVCPPVWEDGLAQILRELF